MFSLRTLSCACERDDADDDSCLPVGCSVPDGLDELLVAGNGGGDDGELAPGIAFQEG